MATLSLQRGSGSNLSELAKKDGQLIVTTDTKKIYLDNGTTRLPLSNSSYCHYSTTTASEEMAGKYYKINITNETSWMLAFTVRLYHSYKFYDIEISGYNYGTSHWYSPEATISSSNITDPIEVTFGYDADWKLWVCIPATAYTGLDIFNVTNGFTQIDLYNAFSVTLVDAIPNTIQTSQLIYRPWNRGENVTAYSAAQLATARTFQIADNDSTNKGPTVSFNGTENVIINLPSTIKANLTGTASFTDMISGTSGNSAVPLNDIGAGKIKYYYNVNNSLDGNMPAVNNANGILYLNTHSGEYGYQLGFSSNDNIYYRMKGGSAFTNTTPWKALLSSGNFTSYVTPTAIGAAKASHTHNYAAASHTHSPKDLQSYYHEAIGTPGTSGYALVATFTIANTYANAPITITLSQRNGKSTCRLYIYFTSADTTDPTLGYFKFDGHDYGCYLYKSATSTWQLYVKKSEAYDQICVVDYTKPAYMDGTRIAWGTTQVSSVPSGATQATAALSFSLSGTTLTITDDR